jgi:hypothetical protein
LKTQFQTSAATVTPIETDGYWWPQKPLTVPEPVSPFWKNLALEMKFLVLFLERTNAMKVNKITTGFVIQVYDTETGRCIEQSFVAGDQVNYEDEHGDPVDWREQPDAYQPFDMVQPEGKSDGHPETDSRPHADDAPVPSTPKPMSSVKIQIVLTLQADLDEPHTESEIRKAVVQVIENAVRLSGGAAICHDLAYAVSFGGVAGEPMPPKKPRPRRKDRRS